MVPGVHANSSETRLASVMAATLRGCVTHIDLPYFCLGGVGNDAAVAFAVLVNIPLS